MNELVKSLEAFWDAIGPWTPGLLFVGLLCWWVTFITSFRQRIGRDPSTAPGRQLDAAPTPVRQPRR